jgi:hypothetical protein
MKAFPHLVQMHKEHATKGLVIVTVSVDPPDDAEMVARANKFLQHVKAPFRHLLINEPSEVWSKKLDFNIPPCYFVFDRQGKWVRFRGGDFDEPEIMYREMDKVILQMLNEK